MAAQMYISQAAYTPPVHFRLFTKESLTKIERRIKEEKAAKELARELAKDRPEGESGLLREEDRLEPNSCLEVGRILPTRLGDFPPGLYGKPIEDIDQYYHNKHTFMVVARDKTIFRFSATNSLFLFSPFNPIRRVAIYILTHPFFSLFVMLVILVNCVFMATTQDIPKSEEIFTGIYTIEGVVKVIARGFILSDFTYLGDAWNWLDFIVVSLAYITMAFPVGNLAAMRTFRVLRALKTVAVVPGLKTIVGALLEAVRRLRDVVILSVFVLSIFALVGLQLYSGSLKRKCVLDPWWKNGTVEPNELRTSAPLLFSYYRSTNKSEWVMQSNTAAKLCGYSDDTGQCPENYTCVEVGDNPNYGYTNFDNFGWAMLCAFRLMTQDSWEVLYQQVIRTNGRIHVCFFIVVIFMGSFYLVNLILAIVAMSYDDCEKKDMEQDMEDEEEEEDDEELMAIEVNKRLSQLEDAMLDNPNSPSFVSMNSLDQFIQQWGPQPPKDKDCISMQSEKCINAWRRKHSLKLTRSTKSSASLPGSPRTSRSQQFNWRAVLQPRRATFLDPSFNLSTSQRPTLVTPCLDNLDLPYADDESAGTPAGTVCEQDHGISPAVLNNLGIRIARKAAWRRSLRQSMRGAPPRGSSAGLRGGQRRLSQHCNVVTNRNRNSISHQADLPRWRDRKGEPTHFRWDASIRIKKPRMSDAYVKRKSSEMGENQEREAVKNYLFSDNPFLCPTPSATAIDIQDILVLKDLINHASGKKGFMQHDGLLKEQIRMKCLQLLFGWECCSGWYRFAQYIELFIMDAFVDLFITLCIVINTVFMALETAGMSTSLANTLSVGNYVFTTIFTAEAILKIVALGLISYLKDKWNCFDVVIVMLSLIELGLSRVKGLSILRSFRLLRVFKLAKSWPTLNLLIGIIGRTMGALGNLCLVLAIIIFIFAVMGMQLYGNNYNETHFDPIPRWNFTDFLHSFMIVFRVLCGEWIESMWDCIHCSGFVCVPFFLLTMIIGNLVVLNLFLALLLSSFGAESFQHSQEDTEANKLQEAVDRINRFIIFAKSRLRACIAFIRSPCLKRRSSQPYDGAISNLVVRVDRYKLAQRRMNNGYPVTNGPQGSLKTSASNTALPPYASGTVQSRAPGQDVSKFDHGSRKSEHSRGNNKHEHVDYGRSHQSQGPSERRPQTSRQMSEEKRRKTDGQDASGHHSWSRSSSSVSSCSSSDSSSSSDVSLSPAAAATLVAGDDETTSNPDKGVLEGPEVNEVKVVFVKYPDECCPQCCSGRNQLFWMRFDQSLIGRIWWKFRCLMFKIVEHRYFETFIIIMILGSSLSLAIEDVHIDREDRKNLKFVLKLMDKIFTIIFAIEMVIKWSAYGFKKYFTDAWCWLDFIIVAIALISMLAEGAGMSNMGAFRALRTLRALRPLRAVSRWEGMKVVVNALIQAIPAIFNVLLVCLVFWLIFSIMGVNLFGGRFESCVDSDGIQVSHELVANKSECLENVRNNYSWVNPKINFDNVLYAYLALFQVATFKGWLPIMSHAIDCKEPGQQPEREARSGMYLYFVFFIVFGSFFTLNLFIGVIIDNFNWQKKKAGGSLEMFMTEDQKKYYNAMKKLGSKQPQKPIPKPRFKWQLFFFQLSTNQKFDVAIMTVILLNMLTMTVEHYEEPQLLTNVLHHINVVFVAIFTLECVVKLVGLRWYFFKQPWNVFDFMVVVMSILGLAINDIISQLMVSPTLLRVVRVFRIGRILRLVKSAKGIRTLLFSLAVSLPALFNIGLLLALVMFIYSIFGMSFFMHVTHNEGIDDIFNFETFGSSMTLLFQISTSAGWDVVLAGLMVDPPTCNDTSTELTPNGNCGNMRVAVMYLVTYLVISFLVVINMYIAVILENFSQATEDVQQGLTQDDFDMYYEVWEQFDEKASQYIPLVKVAEFVEALEEPLRLPAPNFYKLVVLDIPICEGDRVHCVDILDAVARNFLSHGGGGMTDLGDFRKGQNRKDYKPISSTMKRQREIFCAQIIQTAWRRYQRNKKKRFGEVKKVRIAGRLDSIPEVGSVPSSCY